MLYPENERFAHFTDEARVVLSEPLVDLPGRVAGDPRPGPRWWSATSSQETAFTPKEPT